MSYPEPGEITIHVRPSDNRDELFDLQIGLITNEIDLKIDGEMTILDGLFGFEIVNLVVHFVVVLVLVRLPGRAELLP